MRKFARNILLLVGLAMIAFGQFSDASEPVAAMAEHKLWGTHWWVEDIDGHGVIDASHTTIGFPEPGRVAGDTGCNRYMGNVEFDGESLEFGPLAGTRKACHEPIMNQESRFFAAMARAVGWAVADSGLLHLLDADGHTVIRAWRIEDGAA
jgi:heat shock protein HslJ